MEDIDEDKVRWYLERREEIRKVKKPEKMDIETLLLNTGLERIERSETLEVGSNIIAGTTSNKILECTNKMFHVNNSWKNPFGDGKTGKRIVEILINRRGGKC